MEKYIVIRDKGFKDLEDNNHIYKKGDIYPREGLEPTKKRIKELTSEKNKIGEILIKKVEIEETENTEEVVEETENVETENAEEVKEETEITE